PAAPARRCARTTGLAGGFATKSDAAGTPAAAAAAASSRHRRCQFRTASPPPAMSADASRRARPPPLRLRRRRRRRGTLTDPPPVCFGCFFPVGLRLPLAAAAGVGVATSRPPLWMLEAAAAAAAACCECRVSPRQRLRMSCRRSTAPPLNALKKLLLLLLVGGGPGAQQASNVIDCDRMAAIFSFQRYNRRLTVGIGDLTKSMRAKRQDGCKRCLAVACRGCCCPSHNAGRHSSTVFVHDHPVHGNVRMGIKSEFCDNARDRTSNSTGTTARIDSNFTCTPSRRQAFEAEVRGPSSAAKPEFHLSEPPSRKRALHHRCTSQAISYDKRLLPTSGAAPPALPASSVGPLHLRAGLSGWLHSLEHGAHRRPCTIRAPGEQVEAFADAIAGLPAGGTRHVRWADGVRLRPDRSHASEAGAHAREGQYSLGLVTRPVMSQTTKTASCVPDGLQGFKQWKFKNCRSRQKDRNYGWHPALWVEMTGLEVELESNAEPEALLKFKSAAEAWLDKAGLESTCKSKANRKRSWRNQAEPEADMEESRAEPEEELEEPKPEPEADLEEPKAESEADLEESKAELEADMEESKAEPEADLEGTQSGIGSGYGGIQSANRKARSGGTQSGIGSGYGGIQSGTGRDMEAIQAEPESGSARNPNRNRKRIWRNPNRNRKWTWNFKARPESRPEMELKPVATAPPKSIAKNWCGIGSGTSAATVGCIAALGCADIEAGNGNADASSSRLQQQQPPPLPSLSSTLSRDRRTQPGNAQGTTYLGMSLITCLCFNCLLGSVAVALSLRSHRLLLARDWRRAARLGRWAWRARRRQRGILQHGSGGGAAVHRGGRLRRQLRRSRRPPERRGFGYGQDPAMNCEGFGTGVLVRFTAKRASSEALRVYMPLYTL
uniref:GH16 domain-containing protein n=1 Tax=Macrostomum lignano TaxID=282301 RepID=A0A1I8FLX3_9PLAT